jgi:hypothetical protein
MIRKILATILITTFAWAGFALLTPTPVSAACDSSFMGFRPWYYGITKGADCTIMTPGVGGTNDIDLTTFVWTIILNVLSILFGVVGYLAIGFLIYGGFMYVLARGDPGRIAKGKNTVIRAIIGLIICILASLISALIVNIITGATTT